MKHLSRILSLLILVSAGLFLANCKGNDPKPKSEEETQLNKLKANVWKISTVDGPNGNVTTFAGMTVTFSGVYKQDGVYSYTSTPPTGSTWPSPNPWKASSPWKFTSASSAPTFTILATDYEPDLPMTLTFVDSGTLQIKFKSEGQTFTNGRTNSVNGEWTFVFKK